MPHRIQLRGPWEYELLHAETAARGEVTLPAPWSSVLPAGYLGAIILRRRFGRPTGLDAASRVMLVVEAAGSSGRVYLNDELLTTLRGDSDAVRVEINGRLLPRNELRLEISPPPNDAFDPSTNLPDVRLEIE